MKPESFKQLDYRQRETIAISREQGLSIRAIARILDRSASTISRELARNQPGPSYSCHFAQQRHERRKRLARSAAKLVFGNALFETITALLRLLW